MTQITENCLQLQHLRCCTMRCCVHATLVRCTRLQQLSSSLIDMRVLVQRVSRAAVHVGGTTVGQIGGGLLLLAGFRDADDEAVLAWMADKVVGLRIFADDAGLMNRDVRDAHGGLLVVSQFTLYGDARRGRRPSFVDAARPETASRSYDRFVALLRARLDRVETGWFGADMQVESINDGPVTLWLER